MKIIQWQTMLGKHSLLSKRAFINQQIQCLQTQHLISIAALFIGLEQCRYFYEQAQKYFRKFFYMPSCQISQQTDMFIPHSLPDHVPNPGPGDRLCSLCPKKGTFRLTWVNKPSDLNQFGHFHLLSYFWQIHNKSGQMFDIGKS